MMAMSVQPMMSPSGMRVIDACEYRAYLIYRAYVIVNKTGIRNDDTGRRCCYSATHGTETALAGKGYGETTGRDAGAHRGCVGKGRGENGLPAGSRRARDRAASEGGRERHP